MSSEYKIKGISKIIEKVSKEDLARYYGVEQDADFEEIITQSLRKMGVPNGLEVAGYEEANYADVKGIDGYLQDLSTKYIADGKAAIGMIYPITKADMTELYFYIDEPIKSETIGKIWAAKTHLGGVSTLGHTMGKGFYEAPKENLQKQDNTNTFQEDLKNTANDRIRLLNIQNDLKNGKIVEKDLDIKDINLLKKLYCEQILEIANSIEYYTNKIIL